MEKKIEIWELIIKAIASISEDSKYQEVGLKQIFSYIKDIPNSKSKFINTKTIKIEEIFIALTENSDCVELFQVDSITNDDIFFSLRDIPEKSILKARKMQYCGINKMLKRDDIYPTKVKSNDKFQHNLFVLNYNASCY